MSNQQLIVLLVILVAVYLLLKKNDPYQGFKKWLGRHPPHQQRLDQETWDQFFLDPQTKELRLELWKMATFELPIPDNLLAGNKLIISLIREYLREQSGIMLNPNPNQTNLYQRPEI